MSDQLYEQRLERMERVIRNEQPDKVPILSIVDNWAFTYIGYTLKEIFEDDEKHLRAFEKIAEDFIWDGLHYSMTTRPMNFIEILDGGTYRVTDTLQTESGVVKCMEPEEYPQLIKDPWTFLAEVIYPRKYNLMNMDPSEEKYAQFEKAIAALGAYNKLKGISAKRMKEKYQMPVVRPSGFFHPLDMILDFLRDFSGTMMDIKRRPNEVAEACDAMLPICIQNIENFYPEHQKGCCIFNPMHTPQFLKPKDFEKVYWPSYKKILEYLTDKGYIVMCYYERNYEHLYDYLKELPKNKVVGLFEDDDLRKTKKVLGDTMAIAGGMPTYMLNYGKKEECVDYAKSLIDDLAPGGGYIFTTDKILHSANDASPENLKAVNEFVNDYGIYR